MRRLAAAALCIATFSAGAVTTQLNALTYTDYYDSGPNCAHYLYATCYAAPGFFSNINFEGGELARGFAEFELSGFFDLGSFRSATLSFTLKSKQLPGSQLASFDAFYGTYQPSNLSLIAPSQTRFATLDLGALLPGSTFVVDATFFTGFTLYSGLHSFGLMSPTIPPRSPDGATYFSLQDITLNIESTTAPVPEPSTFALMGIGLTAIGGWSKLRRK